MNPLPPYQGPIFIKQLEDAIYPIRGPLTTLGFPHGGKELESSIFKGQPSGFVPLEVPYDFLPFPKNFNTYIYNKKNGYIDRTVRYPIYKTGYVA